MPTDSARRPLTTRQVADRLGVSTDFVVGEIRDGRLKASVLTRPSRRSLYRVSEGALAVYLRAHHWRPPSQET